jgi:hypothetical protein
MRTASTTRMANVSALRVVIAAFLLWASFLLYTHTVFRKVALQPRDHSIESFVRKQGVKGWDQERKELATANKGTVEEDVKREGEEEESWSVNEVTKFAADRMCVMSSQRELCIHNVMASHDLDVAKKFAKLLLEADKRRDRSASEVTLYDAKIACALAIEKHHCIHDVLGTGDLDSAEMYDKMSEKDIDKYMKVSDLEASLACKMVHQEDQEECKKHVMGFNDPETANHYVHLLQDQEMLKEEEDPKPLTTEDADSLCNRLKTNHQFCMQEVLVLPSKPVAMHYIELLQSAHDFSSVVSQQDAEKLCNHIVRKNRQKCTDSLVTMNAKEAALHYSAILKAQLKTKPLLTTKEAESICSDLTGETKTECTNDALTMNDPEAALKYAELLLEKVVEKVA